ncbi:MAG: hypothetical protein QOD58_2284 [Mycobacterium sp.]|jgi:hypothetical protein|nr:hypothetical protein [Mycobacterium sp.]
MSVRTTHFTGTVTDLRLMLGRSRRHGIDRWKVATAQRLLSSTINNGNPNAKTRMPTMRAMVMPTPL